MSATRTNSVRTRVLAAALPLHLLTLLVVMLALLVDARERQESWGRVEPMARRLLAEWAALVTHEDAIAVVTDLDYILDAATLDANNRFQILKGGRALARDRVAALADRARVTGRRVSGDDVPAPGGDPADGELEMLIPVFRDGRFDRAVYLRMVPAVPAPWEALRTVYVVLLAGTLLSMAGTLWALRRWVLRPIGEVARGARRVAQGEFDEPVAVSARRQDEIAAVARAFNEMMAEVAASRQELEARVGTSMRKARAAEKNLVVAQRLAAVGTLAAGIAHDINNPVGGMINAVRALRRDDLSPEKRAQYLEIIEDGLERVAQTVQKVLQFSPHQVAPQACDVAAVTDRALALASHRLERAGVTVAIEMPEDGLPVFGDPWELQQVLLNLLVNASDAIAATGRPEGHVAIRGVAAGEECRLSVEDDGVGMSEELQARAFDLFHTTKDVGEGSGLGLSIVHTIVHSHGGRVDLHSAPGSGTTIEIVLPRHR